MVRAVAIVQAMDPKQKEQLADELFHAQPNMLASVLVLRQLGVSLQKIDFALVILFVCFQAMEESGLTGPVITEDEQDRQLRRFTAITQLSIGTIPRWGARRSS